MSQAVTDKKLSTLSVWVENEPGVLARVIGLFSSRGYNIESLSVSAVGEDGHLSRMTIVTSGSEQIIAQIESQLDRLVPVYQVSNLGEREDCITRDLALFKFSVNKESRSRFDELLRSHEALTIDETPLQDDIWAVVVQLVSSAEAVDAFVRDASFLPMMEMARTGATAMSRGKAPFNIVSRSL